ncbi:MAG: APC family permease [Acidobacteria bacterium]|nr:APC family permease [Acidobacteriota bacterium]
MRERATEHKHGGLRELPATAICGNDITSSCLYVSALAIIHAGKWAWVSLLVVAGVLFLYRRIYAEVVGALPLNGGAYNALLNTTSKSLASMAACLTILSYTATAVISANEAMHYGHGIWPALPVMPATVLLLAAFMLLTIIGITESSKVAVGIFLFHLGTLAVLLLSGGLYLLTNGLAVLASNYALPSEQGLPAALFFGFAASMLGISGFESSANFVEEQAEGVFPRTLRNMWVAVSVLNPTLALLALALVPIPDVATHEEALLAHMGGIAAGEWLAWLISIDAILVLSGAVLTSYVGVTGLVRRMTLDRCLPQFLLRSGPRGTYHRIIVLFFCVCVSILFITEGELEALAGVYTLSFLSVMALFGVGNILLKVKRAGLPRPERAAWPAVILAIALTVLGLAGNVLMNPDYVWVLAEYLLPTLLIVGIMLGRIGLLKVCLFVVQALSEKIRKITGGVSESLQERIRAINSQQFVFFSRGDDIHNLNRVVLYVLKNEHTSRIKVVTVVGDGDEAPAKLERDIGFLNEAYPDIDIELVVIRGRFGPDLVQRLSREWQVPTNFMFIGSPGDHFVYGLAELGGVRLII